MNEIEALLKLAQDLRSIDYAIKQILTLPEGSQDNTQLFNLVQERKEIETQLKSQKPTPNNFPTYYDGELQISWVIEKGFINKNFYQ